MDESEEEISFSSSFRNKISFCGIYQKDRKHIEDIVCYIYLLLHINETNGRSNRDATFASINPQQKKKKGGTKVLKRKKYLERRRRKVYEKRGEIKRKKNRKEDRFLVRNTNKKRDLLFPISISSSTISIGVNVHFLSFHYSYHTILCLSVPPWIEQLQS